MSGTPVPMTSQQVASHVFDTAAALDLRRSCYAQVPPGSGPLDWIARRFVCGFMSGALGTVHAGDIWVGPDGRRLVFEANQQNVYYVLVGEHGKTGGSTLFRQPASGFTGDLLGDVSRRVARDTAPLKPIIEAEMYFLMGLLSVVSGAAAVTIIGMSALQFLVENRAKIPKWTSALGTVMAVRATLKQHAPTLYDKIVDAALTGAWKGTSLALALEGPSVARNTPQSVLHDHKIVSRGVGAIVGKLGKNLFASRLTALSIVWTLLWNIGKAALAGIPGAVNLTMSQQQQAGEAMIAELRRVGVEISQSDAAKIIEEVRSNPEVLTRTLEQLKEAFKDFSR